MATQEEIRIRTEFCAQKLAGGVDVSSATFLAQCQFDVSQRTAYRYVKSAELMLDSEDDAPAESESGPELRMQSLVRLAEMRVLKELSQGDGKDLTAAVNALEKLKKQCGYALQMQPGSATMHFAD